MKIFAAKQEVQLSVVRIDAEMNTGLSMRSLKNFTTKLVALKLMFVLAVACLCPVNVIAQQETETTEQQSKAQKQKAKVAMTSNPAFVQITDIPGLPRVLLLGDSISIGYTIPVREALKGKANIHRPAANCGPTTAGLKSIDAWLGNGQWDVIHFNWGLHDLKYMGDDGRTLADPTDAASHQQVPPAEYEKNLQLLVDRLKQTGARLIWRNTTPVPEGSSGRLVDDAAKYNAVAAKIMQQHGIEVHDLYSFVQPRQDELMLKANVHFTQEGYKALGEEVATVILKALEADR